MVIKREKLVASSGDFTFRPRQPETRGFNEGQGSIRIGPKTRKSTLTTEYVIKVNHL
jgi:hypothetical protein